MRIAAGQEWELATGDSADPLIAYVVDVHDNGYADVRIATRSAPKVILNRSSMHCRDVIDSGILVGGPGSQAARKRREQAEHLRDLLLYAARRSGSEARDDVRFEGEEVIDLVRTDLKVPRDHARALIREALATLGGSET